MGVGAWCGQCGESFRLVELVEDGRAMHCPRCGVDLAPGYGAPAGGAVNEVLAAADTLLRALDRLGDMAPHLHVDRRRLAGELEREG